jgi:rubrerythrin
VVLHDVQHHVRQRRKQTALPAVRQKGNDPTGETPMTERTEQQNDLKLRIADCPACKKQQVIRREKTLCKDCDRESTRSPELAALIDKHYDKIVKELEIQAAQNAAAPIVCSKCGWYIPHAAASSYKQCPICANPFGEEVKD